MHMSCIIKISYRWVMYYISQFTSNLNIAKTLAIEIAVFNFTIYFTLVKALTFLGTQKSKLLQTAENSSKIISLN